MLRQKLVPLTNLFPEIHAICEISELSPHALRLKFELSGALHEILWPNALMLEPKELWRQSCFEFFEFDAESSAYAEWNFSILKEWAHYRFSSYRQKETQALPTVSVKFLELQQRPQQITYTLQIPRIYSKSQFQSTLIISNSKMEHEFFATKHVSNKPDFHQKLSSP